MDNFLITLFPYILGMFGLIVGSFLNVVVIRRGQEKSLGGRSHCVHCNKTLHWYELIPVVSFLVQRGKCRTCKKNISSQYILGECTTGLSFFAVGWFLTHLFLYPFAGFGFFAALIGLLVILSFAICIVLYDIRTKTVPLNWFIGMVLASIVYLLGMYNFHVITSDIVRHGVGILVAVPFLIIWLFSHGRFIGFADIEIIAWMGFFFGAMIGMSSVLIAFYIGAIFSIVWVMYKMIQGNQYQQLRTTPIPFAPFLIIAWFGTLLFQWNIFSLFARLFM